ncbi:MAG: MotA/TolQ/ExbB proton channel family protein, partial [Candidatus Syntrophosphaera sp.]|nr:MotA/TolQ/ExbB proton channel family protein [Candidatus Syntrophosphaera sp.]
MTILNLFLRGGILMYVLVLISIAVVAIVIDKYIYLFRIRKIHERLRNKIFMQDNPEQIREVLQDQGKNCPLGSMLAKLYANQSPELELIQNSMESTANLELHKMEKGMGWLSTFAAIAPLIGFLGTVTGMVRVFMNIQGQGQNSVDINVLAGGIWEALLTTIGGLIVGIVAIVFYNDI